MLLEERNFSHKADVTHISHSGCLVLVHKRRHKPLAPFMGLPIFSLFLLHLLFRLVTQKRDVPLKFTKAGAVKLLSE